MRRTLFNQPGLSIEHCTFAEGPSYDPYHVDEYSIERDGTVVVVHRGLGHWVRVGGHCEASGLALLFEPSVDLPEDDIVEAFTGQTLETWLDWYKRKEEAKLRAHKAHGHPEWMSGFPGEEFCICPCGEHLDYSFNESAII